MCALSLSVARTTFLISPIHTTCPAPPNPSLFDHINLCVFHITCMCIVIRHFLIFLTFWYQAIAVFIDADALNLVVTICTTRFIFRKSLDLPTECIYMLLMDLRTNSVCALLRSK